MEPNALLLYLLHPTLVSTVCSVVYVCVKFVLYKLVVLSLQVYMHNMQVQLNTYFSA